MWPTGIIKRIKWSCAVGGSNCVLSGRGCEQGSCSTTNEKTVVKKHRNLGLEGVNGRGRAEENRHLSHFHLGFSLIDAHS
jgi:hypothetical protein